MLQLSHVYDTFLLQVRAHSQAVKIGYGCRHVRPSVRMEQRGS